MKTLNTQFAVFLVARSICIIGDEASLIAACFKVKSHGSWAIATLLSGLSFAMIAYSFSLAKYLVHRPKKEILLFAFLFQIPFTLLLLTSSLPIIFASNLILGLGQAAILSNSSAWIVDLVDESRIKQAYGLLQTTYATSTAIGLLIGGLLVESLGANTAVILNAVSFVLAIPLILQIKTENREKTNFQESQQKMSGLQIIRKSGALKAFALNLLIMIILIRVYNPLEIFIITDKLGGGASEYGFVTMLSAFSLSIGSAIFTGIIGKQRKLTQWLNKLFFFQGVTFVLISFSQTLILFTSLSIVLYLLISGVNSAIGPIIFEHSNKHELPLVHASMNAIFAVGKISGILAGGLLGGIFSPTLIVVVTGTLITLISLAKIVTSCEGSLE
jgi:DHA1 family multidrug resistance protein-like MFS transporter